MKLASRLVVAAILQFGSACVVAAEPAPLPSFSETEDERDARMRWWREARFGMFIHWGLYAVRGRGEWHMLGAKIPVAEYEADARSFNPEQWDADAVAQLAKRTGMKYIVITAKHHEGFAMWPTRVAGFGLNQTPFRRDPLRELKEACVKHGLKFGLYYSHGQDWTAPSGGQAIAGRRSWDPAQQEGTFAGYANERAIPHCRELLENYRPDIWWWDSSVWMWGQKDPWTARMYDVFKPHLGRLVLNNRWDDGLREKQFDSRAWFAEATGIDHFIRGDYASPECRYPFRGSGKDTKPVLPPEGLDWETCTSIQYHWGYNATAKDRQSPEYIVRILAHCASQGGNLLLNVGPTPTGEIPAATVEILDAVGRWTSVYGESISGTRGGPFSNVFADPTVGAGKDHPQPWDTTVDFTRRDGRLYAHVYSLPANRTIVIPPLRNKVLGVSLVRDATVKIPFTIEAHGLVLTVPESVVPNAIDEVFAVDTEGFPEQR